MELAWAPARMRGSETLVASSGRQLPQRCMQQQLSLLMSARSRPFYARAALCRQTPVASRDAP